MQPINQHDLVWVCEFCGAENLLQIEKEEIPANDDVIYMLKSFQSNQKSEEN